MIVQVYEIQEPREAEKMLRLGVDHIGSVAAGADGWKQPVLRQTIALVAGSGAKSSLIPLFDDIDVISRALDYYRPHIVHFCQGVLGGGGAWEPLCGRLMSMQATVRERFPEIAVMRTVEIPEAGAVRDLPVMEVARHFEPLSDYFLIDTLLMEGDAVACQPEKGYVGITGKTCDWRLAAKLVSESRIPVVLAGGLSPDNVYEAVAAVRPAGVDTCTQTNAEDEAGNPVRFRKDPDKVARFVAEARRAAREIPAH